MKKFPLVLVVLCLVIDIVDSTSAGPDSSQDESRTRLVSVGIDGEPSNHASSKPDMDHSGRYIAFWSWGDNLARGDTVRCDPDHPRLEPINCSDVFVRDLVEGTTLRVSVASNGSELNDSSQVVFASFVDTRMVSLSSEGEQQEKGSGTSCFQSCGGPDISTNGRYVVFDSWSGNLVENDTNEKADVFVRDLESEKTERASVSSSGTEGNDSSWKGDISGDGRYVVFQSTVDNLIEEAGFEFTTPPPFETGKSCIGVYRHDWHAEETVRVDIGRLDSPGNGHSAMPSISNGGTLVAFNSYAENLIPDLETSGIPQVYVKDIPNDRIEIVSINASGSVSNDDAWFPTISPDGRYVAFVSKGTNLDNRFNSGNVQLYVHDRNNGLTVPAVLSTEGNEPNAMTTQPTFNEDGTLIAFTSEADNLVPERTHDHRNVYVTDQFLTFLNHDQPNDTASIPAVGPLFLTVLVVIVVRRFYAGCDMT